MLKATQYLLFTCCLFTSMLVTAEPDFWIDVRTPNEYSTSHVSSAVNIPFDEIANKIAALTNDKNAEIYLYCRSGRRADIAKNTLQNMSYNKVDNIGSLASALKLEKDLAR